MIAEAQTNDKRMPTNIEILKQLKKSYKQGLVSALVGAGFTKNMYKGAVSWWQLLKGIVLVAYDLELKQMYSQYKHQLKFYQFAKPFEQCEDDFIDTIIKRDGYLKVVSNYIKVMGCREAIDVYIEEHNPYFIATPKGLMVSGDPTTILTDDDLSTHRAFLECKWQQIFTTNYDNALEFTSNHFHLAHKVITKDFEMSRMRLNNSIIKIHGNLVDRSKSLADPFEFDNDKSRRYVISEEDYDTYTTRHQAFSYLLRIAMLSGTYCLIGFSGDDPNFLAWLEWVKDILDKDTDKEEQIKVFLVLVDKAPISKERRLFYRNHRIGIINLNDTDIQEEIGVSSPSPTYPDLFKALFSYLSKDNIVVRDPGASVDYNSLWSSIYTKIFHEKNTSYADELEQIRSYRSLMRFDKYYFYQERVLEKLVESPNPLTEEQKLAVNFALRDMCWPVSRISDKITNQLQGEKEWTSYSDYQDTLKAAANQLSNDNDENKLQNVLRAFYCLDFTSAKSQLASWQPSGIWLCRKSSLNYLFDKEKSLKDLEALSSTSSDLLVRYNATVLHDYIEFRVGNKETRSQYKGLDGIPEMVFYHINQLRQPKINIDRYGKQESTVSYKDAVAEPLEKSLRFFRFVTENGINPTYIIVNVISVQDWYLAFRNLMVFYPWACLYYSAQYNNNKVLTRIGQDYAYTSSLKDVLPAMLNRVLSVLVEGTIPGFMRFGLLQICSRFFVAVSEDDYFDQFKEYLQKVYIPEKGDMVYSRDAHTFVALALNSLKSENHIKDVLSLLLDYYESNPKDASILITSHLRWNRLTQLTEKINNQVQRALRKQEDKNAIYIALRLKENNLLAPKVCEIFLDSLISDKNRLSSLSMHPLACLCILAKNNAKYVVALKEEILSREYWGNAYQSSFGGDEQFFRFSLLPKEYVFGVEESVKIALKLEEIFSALASQMKVADSLFSVFYDDLLEEMDAYVNANSQAFSQEFKNKFFSAMASYRGFASIEQAFYGEEAEYIENAIQQVHVMRNKGKYEDIKKYLILALNRLLFKNTIANTKLLDLVALIVWKSMNKIVMDQDVTSKLCLLLQLYAHDDLRIYDFEVVDATYSFLLIAKALKSHGIEDQYIDWWIENENNTRFNYIELE